MPNLGKRIDFEQSYGMGVPRTPPRLRCSPREPAITRVKLNQCEDSVCELICPYFSHRSPYFLYNDHSKKFELYDESINNNKTTVSIQKSQKVNLPVMLIWIKLLDRNMFPKYGKMISMYFISSYSTQAILIVG